MFSHVGLLISKKIYTLCSATLFLISLVVGYSVYGKCQSEILGSKKYQAFIATVNVVIHPTVFACVLSLDFKAGFEIPPLSNGLKS